MSLQPADAGARLGLAADDPRRTPVLLSNPLSAEHAALRTLLLPSLADAAARNQALGRQELAIYEIAHRYQPQDGEVLPAEPWTAGALVAGRAVSFFTAKGILQTVFQAIGLELQVEPGNGRDPFLHPGRAARIVIAGEHAGYLGELHPDARGGLRAERARGRLRAGRHAARAAAARACDRTCQCRTRRRCGRTSRVVVGDEHLAGDVVAAARSAGGELLRDVEVFDVYRDDRRSAPAAARWPFG